MSSRPKAHYTCQQCGFRSFKWLGRCPGCDSWNSLVEERTTAAAEKAVPSPGPAVALQLDHAAAREPDRYLTGIGELDRVLGGGLVPGSVVLVGGDPGIGKSTLMLQALHGLAAAGLECLYVSGEESTEQISMRAQRLRAHSGRMLVAAESSLESLFALVEEKRPRVLAVDSIQTIHSVELESAPGSVSQVRHCAGRLLEAAKSSGRPVFLVGHVTKEGAIAGPRVLEHMVDTVLYFEGDRGHAYRILRTTKNRYGSTNEIGVFEMKDSGLQEVGNPSELFLAERPLEAAGSAVTAAMEGTRPILVELQALVAPSNLAVPRRTTMGVDPNRLALLVAVLEKKAGLALAHHDIFVKVAGGVRIEEPAVDLAVAAAVCSSALDKSIDPRTLLVGEIGLAGEVRSVGRIDIRVKEAAKLGFRRCVLPQKSLELLGKSQAVDLVGVKSVVEVLDYLF